MVYTQIQTIEDEHFSLFWENYKEAFIPEERRDIKRQAEVFTDKRYTLKMIWEQDTYIGFIAYWEIDQIIFVEHIAISKDIRGGGYGSKIIEALTTQYQHKMIVLEVEPIEDELTAARVRFYEKKGFIFNDYEYYQPYNLDIRSEEGLRLYVMSYQTPLDESTFKTVEQSVMEVVYTRT